jgi:TrmH family RNA methyltransferase
VITSRDNEKLKLVRKLHDRRWRDKLGLFFVEGEDAIAAAAGVAEPVELLVAGANVVAELLAEVSTAAHPPRMIAVYRRDDLPSPSPRPVTLALWRLADPGNVGALLRTADSFGAAVALSEGCADPTGPKALRAAAGSIWRVPVLYHANVLTREEGVRAAGQERTAVAGAPAAGAAAAGAAAGAPAAGASAGAPAAGAPAGAPAAGAPAAEVRAPEARAAGAPAAGGRAGGAPAAGAPAAGREPRPRRVALQAHGGVPLAGVDLRGETVFLLGAERDGLPPDVEHDVGATIPIESAESLNVAAAGAIALYEWQRQNR